MSKIYQTLVKPAALTGLLLSSLQVSSAENKKFKVCADPNNPPASLKNETGYENQIASLFAEQIQQQVEYTWFPQRIGFIRNTLKALLPRSEEYRCDIVMAVPAGYELTATTTPYFRSTYTLIVAKNRGFDQIKKAEDILALSAEQKSKLHIAMFDRGPGTTWITRNGLIDHSISYQTMTGDGAVNLAMTMTEDLSNGKVDMAILWGPSAAHVYSQHPEKFTLIPMKSQGNLRFDFPIAMGVRRQSKELKAQLNQLIEQNQDKITQILRSQHVPLVDKAGNVLATK